MGTTHRFIADPSQPSEVLEWFRSLDEAPVEARTDRGIVLYFSAQGPLAYQGSGNIDERSSPIVTIFLPRARRGELWTVGEAHFLSTPLRRFPSLQKVNLAFGRWLSRLQCVYSNGRSESDFNYYLEGSIRNYDTPVFAFDSGLRSLQDGRYFVADDDSEARLDSLCRALRLRGIECAAT